MNGGSFNDYNKKGLGTWTRTFGRTSDIVSPTDGVVAIGLVSDWAPEDKLYQITASEFVDDPIAVTGHEYDAKENIVLRELFRHANTLLTYKLNSGSKKATSEVGEALRAGNAGNNVTVSVSKNIIDQTKYDVTTYYNGVEKDSQTVPEAGVDKITLAKGDETPGETVETAAVDLTFKDNTVAVKFTNVPELYTAKTTLKLNDTPVELEENDITLEESDEGKTFTYKFSTTSPSTGDYSLESALTKVEETKILKTTKFKANLTKNVTVGADGSKLNDNNFVVFKDEVLPVNAGYTFTGGTTSKTVSADSHNKFLNAVEGRSFNILVGDTDDTAIKAVYTAFTKRLRDNRGIYFQTVLYQADKVDYEGVVSVYNNVTTEGVNVSALVNWVGGYLSSAGFSEEATNKPYDGELNVNTNISQTKIDQLSEQGYFLFNDISFGDIRTYIDCNTLQTMGDGRNEAFKSNKSIRILDYILNQAQAVLNDAVIGQPNTPETQAFVRVLIRNIVDDVANSGAIQNFNDNSISVSSVPGSDNKLRIDISLSVAGTIRQIYVTAYVENE